MEKIDLRKELAHPYKASAKQPMRESGEKR